jgi:diguanylate cyclase (GGDEF)-like protein
MRVSLRPGVLGAVAIVAWLVVMVVAGWVLAGSQSSSRRAVAGRLEARTRYAATFVSIYVHDLLERDRSAAQSWFVTREVSRATLERAASALGLSAAVVLDAHGHPIATLSGHAASIDRMLAGRDARVAGAGAGASRISLVTTGGTPRVSFAVRYETTSGPRVFMGAYAMAGTALPTVLDNVLTTQKNWEAYLIDPAGGRLVAGGASRPYDAQNQFSATVRGTAWRIVVRDPSNQLYGFLNGPGRWLAWVALAGLALAGLAILGLITRLARRRRQLIVLNGELARLAAVDSLTGLRNRRAIEQHLHDALSTARRHDLPLSVLVIDADHFKSFNDTLGHKSGDAILTHTAQVFDGALRAQDAIGRWGGEEFLVVLPGTDEEGALHVTERLRSALAADQPEAARAHGLTVTVTIGVAEWRGEEMDELVSHADGALYGGKAAGRDTTRVSPFVMAGLEAAESN